MTDPFAAGSRPAEPPPADTAPEGTADMVRLLTPDGERVEHRDFRLDPLQTDGEMLRGFYRDMVMVRRFDTEATALQRQGELALWASLYGQEAAQIGSARAMARQDYAFTTYREHGVGWCRGLDPVAVLRLFRGVSLGDWDPAEVGMHGYAIVIGVQALHAAGYAMGIQRDGNVGTGDPGRDAAVIAYFGDGAISQGDVNEAFVFAASFNAPVVFFCQNNQWAISVPKERQSRIPLYRRASGFGFPGVQVDGNDVLAVHAVTTAALQRARRGDGPTLIEAVTYRMGPHTTSDDPGRYRPEAEVEHWRLLDPIARLAELMRRTGDGDEQFFDQVAEEAQAFAGHLRQACQSIPDPLPQSIFDHVYASGHAQVDQERAWFEAYQAGFEADLEPAPAGGA
jgi:2-oxoisovalerate dehydrogenase E1 component alpha subunit